MDVVFFYIFRLECSRFRECVVCRIVEEYTLFWVCMHTNNVHGSNMLCNTKVIRETGRFDVHIRDGEDTDLGYRPLRKGFKIYFIDNIICGHTVQPSMRSLMRRAFPQGCAGSLLLMKYQKLKLQDLAFLAFSALLLIGFLFLGFP